MTDFRSVISSMTSKATFFNRLEASVKQRRSLLCIGLDPHPGMSIQEASAFCQCVIFETNEFAAAYKPNSAFFEQFGPEGFAALKDVISSIPNDIPVILDVKRGDIENTAEAYARAAYVVCGADAVTLSPYMGYDSIRPFTTGDFSEKAAFILCKTSNPTAREVQELVVVGDGGVQRPLFEQVARLCLQWPNPEALGLVVGATDVSALARVRSIAPDTWVLCPGVGAQGGILEEVCGAGLRADGSGLLVSVSRSIASQFALGPGAMTADARRLRDQINTCRAGKQSTTGAVPGHLLEPDAGRLKDYQRQFLSFAVARGALQFGSFALKSGRISPYFFNAGAFSTGACLNALGRFYAQAIRDSGIDFDVLFGPAYKGIALASAAAMWWDQLGYTCAGGSDAGDGDVEVAYNRKEVKDHGEGGQLVGAAVAGRRVLVVDDVITAGTAVRETVRLLRQAGAVVVGVAVCLDRQERVAEDNADSAVQAVEREFGFPVISIVGLNHLAEYLNGQEGQEEEGGGLAQAAEVAAYRQRYGV